VIQLLLIIVVLGILFSMAFLRFFQGYKGQGALWSVLFAAGMVAFYWSIAAGILVIEE
jgi:hypothetical protein